MKYLILITIIFLFSCERPQNKDCINTYNNTKIKYDLMMSGKSDIDINLLRSFAKISLFYDYGFTSCHENIRVDTDFYSTIELRVQTDLMILNGSKK